MTQRGGDEFFVALDANILPSDKRTLRWWALVNPPCALSLLSLQNWMGLVGLPSIPSSGSCLRP